MKLLLFDIDMTLVSTGGAGIRALDRAFETVLGTSGALESVKPHGKTDPSIIREACRNMGIAGGPRTEEQILEQYVRFLESEVADSESYRVLPGVEALLELCATRRTIVLGLATGNVETGARIKLDRGQLNAYFRFGGFGSDSSDRAEVVQAAFRRGQQWQGVEILAEDTWVIGDTPMDIRAGKSGGFRTVAVATGTYRPDQLEAAGPDLVIGDFAVGRDQFLETTRIV